MMRNFLTPYKALGSALALTLAVSAMAVPGIAAAQQGSKAAKAEAAKQAEIVQVDPNRLLAATTLVNMLDMERTLDSMFGNLKNLFAENVVANMSRDANGAEFFNKLPGGRDRFSKELADEFLTGLRASYPEFREAAAREYARQFSVEELHELTRFFGSGVGAKWRAVAPEIEKSMSAWGEKIGMKVGMETMTTVMKRLADEQKKGEKK